MIKNTLGGKTQWHVILFFVDIKCFPRDMKNCNDSNADDHFR